MDKLVRIINNNNQVEIFEGNDITWAKSQGFEEKEIEYSDINYCPYLKGYAPMYSQEEKIQKERGELDKLSLTKREVFLALYKDKKITPEQLKAQISDPEALIEFEYANEYFRGNPLIEQIGNILGYTKEKLDYLFKNGKLPPKEVIEND